MIIEKDPAWILASKTTLEAVRAYLEANGWILPQPGADFYIRPSKEHYRGFVNLRNDVRVVPEILDAARAVAYYEGRDVVGVLESILAYEADRVKCRLVSARFEEAVPLADAAAFVKGMAAMLASTVAASEKAEFMRAAKFLSTERGSFVVNVTVPPEYREALERMTTALSATEPTAPEILSRAAALVGKDAELEISVGWSPKRPTTAPSFVKIDQARAKTFRKWTRKKKRTQKNVVAKIVKLERDEKGARAVLRAEGFEKIVKLANEDFQLALEAFGADRPVVVEDGRLRIL